MDSSEREKNLKIPSSAIFPLIIVGFFGLNGLNDFAEAGTTVVTKGLDQVFSNPDVGSRALFEVIWGSGQLAAAGLFNLLFKNPLGKIKIE